MHAHPEIGHQEVEAARRLSGLLTSAGIPVEMGTAGMATAFKAELGGRSSMRPRVAILAEYDALPGLGHGCGHNLIGTSAIGAGLALSEVIPELAGSIWVLGTPAEESAAPNSGGKVHMVNAGIFSDVDAAIMFHPGSETAVTLDRSLAARGFEFFFHGKAAHAAGAPEDGNNERRRSGRGSTDFGNVSRRVPGIEARIAITDNWDVPGHSIEFREAAGSDHGRQAMIFAAKSLAMTAVDLLADPELLRRAKL